MFAIIFFLALDLMFMLHVCMKRTYLVLNKGNNKITEHRAIFQRENQQMTLIVNCGHYL